MHSQEFFCKYISKTLDCLLPVSFSLLCISVVGGGWCDVYPQQVAEPPSKSHYDSLHTHKCNIQYSSAGHRYTSIRERNTRFKTFRPQYCDNYTSKKKPFSTINNSKLNDINPCNEHERHKPERQYIPNNMNPHYKPEWHKIDFNVNTKDKTWTTNTRQRHKTKRHKPEQLTTDSDINLKEFIRTS